MGKTHIFFGLAILAVALYGIDEYGDSAACYEIVQVEGYLNGNVLLDKCKGRTWTLVQHEATPAEIIGYIAEEKEEKVKTLVWTRLHKGQGMLSFGNTEE